MLTADERTDRRPVTRTGCFAADAVAIRGPDRAPLTEVRCGAGTLATMAQAAGSSPGPDPASDPDMIPLPPWGGPPDTPAPERPSRPGEVRVGDPLDAVLDQFDRQHERRPNLSKPDRLRDEVRWLGDFEAHRERVLRPELEAMAWRLERSGHHAWIEEPLIDEALELASADRAARQEAQQTTSEDVLTCTGLEFKALAVADQRSARAAPGLRFSPDPETEQVLVIEIAEPGAARVVDALTVGELNRIVIDRLVTAFIAEALLRRDRVLETHEDRAASDDWSPERGGIVPRAEESDAWR